MSERGAYSQSDIFTHVDKPFWELSGKRFGIIGLGHIGCRVAKIAEAFGAEVVYYSASGQSYQQPYQRLELEEFLNTSDIVSIHAPLNEYTRNLLHYGRLQLMKKNGGLDQCRKGRYCKRSGSGPDLERRPDCRSGHGCFRRGTHKSPEPALAGNEPGKAGPDAPRRLGQYGSPYLLDRKGRTEYRRIFERK